MYHHSNPVPQRSHKKSKNGCVACRARKVKCDEKHPVCGRCAIHFANITSCDYRQPTRTKKTSTVPSSKKEPALTSTAAYAPTLLPDEEASEKPPSCTALYSLLSAEAQAIRVETCKPSATQYKSRALVPAPTQCNCPCHVPEFTKIMLDAIFGICRICGNLPSLDYPITSCVPVVSPSQLMRSQIDPFNILPAESSQQVVQLVHHWINTLALFPTRIHTQYCTNPNWLSTAIANSALFHVTLYICSVHLDGIRGKRQSAESLFYKTKAIRVLNEILRDPTKATSDETISAVMLLGNVLSIIGEPEEVSAHLNGLQQMVNLRGGIDRLSIDGCFLHMLCTTNHLSAVLSESLAVLPPTGVTYTSSCSKSKGSTSSTTDSRSSYPKSAANPSCTPPPVYKSPLFKPFAIACGFNETVVEMFHDMGYLYAVLEAFTLRLLPIYSKPFKDLTASIKADGDSAVFHDPNPAKLYGIKLAAVLDPDGHH